MAVQTAALAGRFGARQAASLMINMTDTKTFGGITHTPPIPPAHTRPFAWTTEGAGLADGS